jgi:hypothetical protein
MESFKEKDISRVAKPAKEEDILYKTNLLFK